MGFTVILSKPVLVPMQDVDFLGITLNSMELTATLPLRRRSHNKSQGGLLLEGGTNVHALAVFIDLTVASDPAVTLVPLEYKFIRDYQKQGIPTKQRHLRF